MYYPETTVEVEVIEHDLKVIFFMRDDHPLTRDENRPTHVYKASRHAFGSRHPDPKRTEWYVHIFPPNFYTQMHSDSQFIQIGDDLYRKEDILRAKVTKLPFEIVVQSPFKK